MPIIGDVMRYALPLVAGYLVWPFGVVDDVLDQLRVTRWHGTAVMGSIALMPVIAAIAAFSSAARSRGA